MKAAVVTAVGAPPQPADTERPAPGNHQALVKVVAAPLNPVEIRVAAGRMPRAPEPPYVPGLEGSGTVVTSARFPVGTRVRFENDLPGFGKNGALAEFALADDEVLVELPAGVSDEEAAAAGVVGVTARLALLRAGLTAGERVAVLGATGGVGQMAVQLARLGGASSVVAVGRDAETLEMLTSRGATATVSLDGESDLAERLQVAAGGPLDVVVDVLWGSPAMAAIAALGDEGRLVNVGNTAGTDVTLPLQAMRQSRSAVVGLSSGWAPPATKVAAYGSVLAAIAAGDVSVAHEVVDLDQIADAWHRQATSPHHKLVVSLA